MLEDPSYSQVVRWGDDGGSFVVLEVRYIRISLAAIAIPNLSRRTKDLPNQSSQNISNTATSQVLCASSTSMTSIKCGTTMKRAGIPHMAQA